METTRHFVTTVYLVNDGKTALHEHKKLGLLLPPGGHIDRDELPHEAAQREVLEETGIDIDIGSEKTEVGEYSWSRGIPEPEHVVLDDIVIKGEKPAHQHINLIYYVDVDTTQIRPEGDSEVGPEDWYWFTADELRDEDSLPMELDGMTRELGIEAINAHDS